MIRIAALLAAVAAASPAFAEESDHLAELDGLRAVHAWTRATDGAETLVFVEIENEGETPVTLEGARADGLVATLVGFRMQDGEGGYETIPSMPVAPGRELHLEPDGLAIRLTGLTDPLAEGGEIEMELLTSLGALPIHVEVEAADATTHSHAGHSH
jgi:copper(I)-binding protein